MDTETRIRVRMYRQGLGDCFLLSIAEGTTTDGTLAPSAGQHMLIDCGVLPGTPSGDKVMQQVVADIAEATHGHVDVLAVTHAHLDHISGFAQAAAEFGDLDVGQIWLSWAEKPDDPLAQQLGAERQAALARTAGASRKLAGQNLAPALVAAVDALLEFEEPCPALGARANGKPAGIMDALRTWHGGATPVQYQQPGAVLGLAGLPSVRIYVLGPPRSRERIQDTLPGKAHETYRGSTGLELNASNAFGVALDAWLGATNGATDPWSDLGDRAKPFTESQSLKWADAQRDGFFAEHYFAADEQWRLIDNEWLAGVSELALSLGNATNNTSLVLAFELVNSGKVLLFPGDAQVGNWLSWYDLPGWQIEGRTVTVPELLSRTVLYKVGHHGSDNATLREKGLELMRSAELTALLPLGGDSADSHRWPMAAKELLSRLTERTSGRVLTAAPRSSESEWAENQGLVWAKSHLAYNSTPLYHEVTITG